MSFGQRLLSLLLLLWPTILLSSQPTPVTINWLDQQVPTQFNGNTFGVAWPRGTVNRDQSFQLQNEEGRPLPAQTWPLAYWPDGSVKWTAVAAAPDSKLPRQMQLLAGPPHTGNQPLTVEDYPDSIVIKNGTHQTILAKSGSEIIRAIYHKQHLTARNGHLVLLHQNTPEAYGTQAVVTTPFRGLIKNIELEQSGPVRALVKVEGTHFSDTGKTLLPFVLRLYFYAGSNNIRIMHTIIYDGDEEQDFIRGLGLRMEVPMHQTELYNRHVRFTSADGGLFGEAVQGLTGLRREAGKAVTSAQLEGRPVPPLEEFPERTRRGLPYIPAFGDYSLFQGTPEAFSIKKRTKEGHSWLKAGQGNRANGTAYMGSTQGGAAFSIRNFWQSYPAQIDIKNAAAESAEVTLWLWAPEAPAMDLRFYHDGMGMDSYEKQWEGLEITYEDYEPGYGRPLGVARTSELHIQTYRHTPGREEILDHSRAAATPPVLMADLQQLQQSGVFGQTWTVRQANESESPARQKIEERLDWLFNFYQLQVAQHRWYGFWDYGDFMHTYDSDRHVWRYDVGGYAWDNSELATDIWLWNYFLHSGRADVFRLAEAMTRHTGEVDVHHQGPFAPLGSRHNVQHWGCSAKQMRISTVANRRYYYYLTADERVGDLMDEQLNAHKALLKVPPLRKRMDLDLSDTTRVTMSFGTDWGAIASAWLTHWERTEDPHSLERLKNSMRTIAAQPQGFFTGLGSMDTHSGTFELEEHTNINVSHLNAVFGLTELNAELIDLFDMPEFEAAWLRYCTLYNAPQSVQKKELGATYRNHVLYQGHSRLSAYAAYKTSNQKLGQRAWQEFSLQNPEKSLSIPNLQQITGPNSLRPINENPEISTNYAAQWGLAALQLLRYLEQQMPGDF